MAVSCAVLKRGGGEDWRRAVEAASRPREGNMGFGEGAN